MNFNIEKLRQHKLWTAYTKFNPQDFILQIYDHIITWRMLFGVYLSGNLKNDMLIRTNHYPYVVPSQSPSQLRLIAFGPFWDLRSPGVVFRAESNADPNALRHLKSPLLGSVGPVSSWAPGIFRTKFAYDIGVYATRFRV